MLVLSEADTFFLLKVVTGCKGAILSDAFRSQETASDSSLDWKDSCAVAIRGCEPMIHALLL